MPGHASVLRARAGVRNSIEKWLAATQAPRKHPGGFIQGDQLRWSWRPAYDSGSPPQCLGIRLDGNFDTCEVIEERWTALLRASTGRCDRNQAGNLSGWKELYIELGERNQFNSLYGAPPGLCGGSDELGVRIALR